MEEYSTDEEEEEEEPVKKDVVHVDSVGWDTASVSYIDQNINGWSLVNPFQPDNYTQNMRLLEKWKDEIPKVYGYIGVGYSRLWLLLSKKTQWTQALQLIKLYMYYEPHLDTLHV